MTKTVKLVKIVKTLDPAFWYADSIGETLFVTTPDEGEVVPSKGDLVCLNFGIIIIPESEDEIQSKVYKEYNRNGHFVSSEDVVVITEFQTTV
jgi:hypothetical protein